LTTIEVLTFLKVLPVVSSVAEDRLPCLQRAAEKRLLQAKAGAHKRKASPDRAARAAPAKAAERPSGRRQEVLDDSDDDF
jgi:hypothetical protein